MAKFVRVPNWDSLIEVNYHNNAVLKSGAPVSKLPTGEETVTVKLGKTIVTEDVPLVGTFFNLDLVVDASLTKRSITLRMANGDNHNWVFKSESLGEYHRLVREIGLTIPEKSDSKVEIAFTK